MDLTGGFDAVYGTGEANVHEDVVGPGLPRVFKSRLPGLGDCDDRLPKVDQRLLEIGCDNCPHHQQ
ncbi:MAG: hypothetical protein M0R30_11490 [Methanoregula sp.]|jgi:hypothetical protein|nr:hypothetical protein [Methanoregula sp.]MCK9632247.1 hypothetical protein [Methanoregula sp.]